MAGAAGAAGAAGVPVGALIIRDKRQVQPAKAALMEENWMKGGRCVCRHGGAGDLALHVNAKGAEALSAAAAAGGAPWGALPSEALSALLRGGDVSWLARVRLGSPDCMGPEVFAWYRQGGGARGAPPPPTAAAAAAATTFLYVELFAGIGGFRAALDPLGGSCAFASELDADARRTYAANYGGDAPAGDILELESSDIPPHDMLTAGFPCQPYSKAGAQRGFADERGELFWEITRVLHARRPRTFLLENVPNLANVDGGSAFETILAALRGAGYTVHHKVVNASAWLPQDRDRLYIVGLRADAELSAAFAWPEAVQLPPVPPLRTFLQTAEEAAGHELSPHQWQRIQESRDYVKSDGAWRLCRMDGAARTLASHYRSGFLHNSEFVPVPGAAPRFYTPRECARVMGFAESYRLDACTDAGRIYHQLGNAVCPAVVEAVALAIIATGILGAVERPPVVAPAAAPIAVASVPSQVAADPGGANHFKGLAHGNGCVILLVMLRFLCNCHRPPQSPSLVPQARSAALENGWMKPSHER